VKIFRLNEDGEQIAVIHSYAPGDGNLSFVASDPRTTKAVHPPPTLEECRQVLRPGWELYPNGSGWRARKQEQNNCDGSGPHTLGTVKLLPSGGDSNLILCRACWLREILYRAERNQSLGEFAQFALPTWESGKVYGGAA